MKIKLKHLLLIPLLLPLQSCLKDNLKNKILKEIENCGSVCMIDLNKITEFKWDKVYIFNYNATKKDIDEALETTYMHYTEFSKKIIFTKAGKIVYHETIPINIESVSNKELVFEDNNLRNYMTFHSNKAIFRVSKERINDVFYYKLFHMQ